MSSEPVDRPSEPPADADAGARAGEPSEAELRAAYEAELSRITSAEVMLQSAVSLLNIGSRRLGIAGAATSAEPGAGAGAVVERDLEQVRDAIDGVRALLSVLERRLPRELGPLRDALSQLQIAYSREAQADAVAAEREPGSADQAGAAAPGSGAAPGTPGQASSSAEHDSSGAEDPTDRPGPAESSGRLWVPGR
jgi:hypothetical protein